MRLETFAYVGSRWSVDLLPALDSDQTVVIAFGASSFHDDPTPFVDLKRAYPRSKIVGCSTSGEILGTKISDGTVAVAVLALDKSRAKCATAEVTSGEGSRRAGEQIAACLAAPDLRSIVVLSDGLNVNGSELVRGLNTRLSPSVIVTGGLAGDGDRFKRTWILDGERPVSNRVSAVGLYGDCLRIGHGSKGGWDIFGPERIVTRSEGNILYELDGRPALELYKNYLGDRAAGLPATALLFPLALREDASPEKSLVRTVLGIDEARQSMTFAGDVPRGARAQLMCANFDRLVQGAADAALLTAGQGHAAGPTLAIAVSCVGRRLVLGERSEEEIEATSDALPSGTRQVGFYSYGELSPYASGACDLHNQTMTLTTIAEA